MNRGHATIEDTLKDPQDAAAVKQLKDKVDGLRELMKANKINEPIYIVAHSQGTMITLAAMSQGMKVDKALLLHSPHHKENGRADLEKAGKNGKTIWLWDTLDPVVTVVNGYRQGANHELPDLEALNGAGVGWNGEKKLFARVLAFTRIGNHGTWCDPHYGVAGPAGSVVEGGYGGVLQAEEDNAAKWASRPVELGLVKLGLKRYGGTKLEFDNATKRWKVTE